MCGSDTLVRHLDNFESPQSSFVTDFPGHKEKYFRQLGQECPSHTADAIHLAQSVRATLVVSMNSHRIPLDRMYEYRRMLPHYQKAGRAIFVTFCKNDPTPFSPQARDLILRHCLHDNGKRYELHAAVIMPEHVHLLLTPMIDANGWPIGLPAILKALKGSSARSVNMLGRMSGPVWQEESFDHVLRSQESKLEKVEYIRQNAVRRGLAHKAEDYPWLWVQA